jgi:ubiquitin domain-containing protein
MNCKLNLLILCLVGFASRSGFAMAPNNSTQITQTLFVRTKNGNYQVEFNPQKTIRDLKNYLQSKTDIPSSKQRIIFRGQEVPDEMLLVNSPPIITRDGWFHMLEKRIIKKEPISKDLQPKKVEEKTPIEKGPKKSPINIKKLFSRKRKIQPNMPDNFSKNKKVETLQKTTGSSTQPIVPSTTRPQFGDKVFVNHKGSLVEGVVTRPEDNEVAEMGFITVNLGNFDKNGRDKIRDFLPQEVKRKINK